MFENRFEGKNQIVYQLTVRIIRLRIIHNAGNKDHSHNKDERAVAPQRMIHGGFDPMISSASLQSSRYLSSFIMNRVPTDFYTGSPESYRLCGLADSEH